MKRNAKNLLRTFTMSSAILFALYSCNKKTETVDNNAMVTDTTAQSTDSTATSASPVAALTDAQIASIAVTANQIDIDYAKIAQGKATNPDVKMFAETMAKDHQSIIDQAVALATKLNLTPDNNNDTTKSLLDGAAKEKAKLEATAKGTDFDKAYVDNEVAYHTSVVDVVDNTLIPNAQNAELKKLLQSASPLFKAHLDHAKKVQAELNK
ncbi:DUF4142 domain-containing protein [Halpernia sp.]|uniref:DUF4142 domain-containing protein n=1 Tax=Halpernia sp. TaxID=2782209 RepID=UPI003A915C47